MKSYDEYYVNNGFSKVHRVVSYKHGVWTFHVNAEDKELCDKISLNLSCDSTYRPINNETSVELIEKHII